MAPPARTRDERWPLGLGAGLVGLGLVGVWSCGPTVSLDTPPPPGASSTGAGSSGGVTSSGDEPPTEPIADLPGPDVSEPLPPGTCPADCTVELTEQWIYEEDPEQAPPASRRLTGMIQAPDGTIIIAEHRDGLPWLTRLSPTGSEVWSIYATLPCNCAIVDMALTPGGKLLVVGQGDDFGLSPVMSLSRFDLVLPSLDWNGYDLLYQYFNEVPRVGSVFAIDDVYTGLLVVEANIFGDATTSEVLEVLTYENDNLFDRTFVDSQPYAEFPWRPLGERTPDGGLVVAFTDNTASDEDGYLVWLDSTLEPTAVEPLPAAPEGLVLGAAYDVLTVGHAMVSEQQLSIYVSRARSTNPPEWVHTEAVATTSDSTPALTMDSTGAALVALRTTAGDQDDPSVLLMRVAADGTHSWTTTLPIAADASERPVFSIVDPEDALLIATLVDGRLHVEKREQGCQCG